MAGVTESRLGQHLTATESPAAVSSALTAFEMRDIAQAEGQTSRDILEAQLIELRRVVLGLVIGTENELEDPGPG